MEKFDAIIIGSGQSGTPLAKRLAKAGMNTVLIEKKYIGGTCINDGCTPTKAMIACAKLAYQVFHADQWGIKIDSGRVDLKKIILRKNKIVNEFREASKKSLQKTKGLTLLHGEAHFIGPKQLMVLLKEGEVTLTAEKIFIDVGQKPQVPNLPGIDNAPYFTTTTLLDVVDLPSHLLILGGSYNGLEFGQMYRRFGSDVTIIESATHILPKEDEDISNAMREILEKEGIKVLTNCQWEKIEHDQCIDLTITTKGKQQVLQGSHLLLATGRIPQTKILQLENTNVTTDAHGYIPVNEYLETNISGIYALGDVNGGAAFTHTSYQDYLLIAENLLEGASHSVKNRPLPYCMFTDPQLGRIGLTEKEAREKGLKIQIATLPMNKTSRGIETGNTQGMMKAIVEDPSGKILGAAILGEEGGEVMSVLQMAMLAGLNAMQLRGQIFAHPLYSESLNNLFMMLDK